MAKGFSVMDLMSEISREGAAEEIETIEKVSIFDLQPNESNFYKISGIEQLKNSIYAMGGVQQNLLLVRIPSGGKFKYRILAGHRRTKACMELVQEGHREFEYVPAVIRENIGKNTEDALLVMTNSTQRELTDWEKVVQHMKLKEIIPKLKKRHGLDGKTRTLEADYLGISEGQIAIYNTIGTKLNAWLMDAFKNGDIGISLAYEAAKLEPKLQKKLVNITLGKGKFTEDDIRMLISNSPIKGQLEITEKSEEDAGMEKVTESDTTEKIQMEPVHTPETEEKEISSANKENDVESATDFISGNIEKVELSDNTDESPAAVDENDEKQEENFRGGYEPILIKDLIHRYDTYLGMAQDENINNLICEYNCLLDALELLEKRINKQL